jgi:hypothetical protein
MSWYARVKIFYSAHTEFDFLGNVQLSLILLPTYILFHPQNWKAPEGGKKKKPRVS